MKLQRKSSRERAYPVSTRNFPDQNRRSKLQHNQNGAHDKVLRKRVGFAGPDFVRVATYEKHNEIVFAGSAKATKESDHHDDATCRQAKVTGGVVAFNLHVVGVCPQGTVASDPDRHTQQCHAE